MMLHMRRALYSLLAAVNVLIVLVRKMVGRAPMRRVAALGVIFLIAASLTIIISTRGGAAQSRKGKSAAAAGSRPRPPSTLPPPFHVITECSEEQNRRQQHLLDVCKTFKRRGLGPDYSPNTWLRKATNIYVLEAQKAIFCYIPHTSSLVAWKHKLLSDLGVFPEMDIDMDDPSWVAKVNDVWDDMHVRLGLKPLSSYGRGRVDYLTTHYFKFISVRHPLERIYADYQEKILDPITSNSTFYHSKVTDIRKAFQDAPAAGNATQRLPYELFVKDLIASYPHLDGMHTKMAIDYCDPCAIYYNFIIKHETFETDVKCLLKHLDMSAYFPGYKASPGSLKKARALTPRLLTWLQDEILVKDYDIFGY